MAIQLLPESTRDATTERTLGHENHHHSIRTCGNYIGLSASNHDQPQPSPHSLLPGWVSLLSRTMTNQPFNVWAWLTVPVFIGSVAVSNTSFTNTEPSGIKR